MADEKEPTPNTDYHEEITTLLNNVINISDANKRIVYMLRLLAALPRGSESLDSPEARRLIISAADQLEKMDKLVAHFSGHVGYRSRDHF